MGGRVKVANSSCMISFGRICVTAFTLVVVSCAPVNQARKSVVVGASGDRSVVASPLTAQLIDSGALASVNSIAIAPPALMYADSQGGLSVDDASDVIERIAREKMTLKVLSAPREGKSGLSRSGLGKDTPALADAILRTEILRYDRRQGSAFGGEPAVVSFRMNLEQSGKRSPMWSAQYFLRQEALSENLLRLGERVGPAGLGAGWKSAEEVFERGVAAALADLNAQRERQFIVK